MKRSAGLCAIIMIVLLVAVQAACVEQAPDKILKIPFAKDSPYTYQRMCTQGVGQEPSHNKPITWYDIDLDTPNDADENVLAPIDGMAFTHDDGGPHSFGNHINIDLGDGTFVVLAHLKSFSIPSGGISVRQGQIIGIEGGTGFALGGDHLHLGLHAGNAWEDALKSISIPLKYILTRDITSGETDFQVRSSADFNCALPGGDIYDSNTTAGCCTPANDLDCWHWAFDYWMTMLDRSIFSGAECQYDHSLTCIFPERSISRVELAKVAVNAFNIPLTYGPPYDPFTDMVGHPLHDYVATLWRLGVVSGCDATHFCPDKTATRAETAKILINAAKSQGYPITVNTNCLTAPYTDVPVSNSLCKFVEAAKAYNFVNGYPPGTVFKPNNPITRSEVARIVHDMLACLGIP